MDTVILTRRGWLSHDEIVDGDETPGFNPETGQTEWTRITAVTTFDEADIIESRSHSWSVRSTANHRWVARDRNTGKHYWCTTDGERSGEHAPTGGKVSRGQDTWVIAAPLADGEGLDLTDDECELLGWLMTDGSQWRATDPCSFDDCRNTARGGGLCGSHRRQERKGGPLRPLRPTARPAAPDESTFIWQTKPASVARLRALLGARAGYNGKGFRLHGSYAADLLNRAGLTHIKDAGQLMTLIAAMSGKQRTAMLDGLIGGDGLRTRSAGSVTDKLRIMQDAGPLLDVITTLAYYCGYRTTVTKHECSPSCWSHNGTPMIVHLGRPRVSTYRQGRPVVARARVWCPTTELGSWTAKFGDNVVLTGNSHVHWAYDQGGYLEPGVTSVYNGTGKPEPVFTAGQWDMLDPSNIVSAMQSTPPTLEAVAASSRENELASAVSALSSALAERPPAMSVSGDETRRAVLDALSQRDREQKVRDRYRY